MEVKTSNQDNDHSSDDELVPKTTAINTILVYETDITKPKVDKMKDSPDDLSDLKEVIFDFDNEQEDQIIAFMKWHDQPNDIVLEITNKLCTMYLFSGTHLIRNLMIGIINTSGVRDVIKIEFAKILCYHEESDENFDILANTIEFIENSPLVILIECIVLLMKSQNSKHKTQCLDYFVAIVNNSEYEIHFRYRTILSLEFKLDEPSAKYFIKLTLLEFINCPSNSCTYRILAAQALLQKYFPTDLQESDLEESDLQESELQDSEHTESELQDSEHTESELLSQNMIQTILMDIMNDQELDPNVRADAADVLLNLGTSEFRSHATTTILLLGALDGAVRTVYQDAQNTHNTEIEQSALEILEKIDIIENNLTFEKSQTKIIELTFNRYNNTADTEASEEKMIRTALNRISVDRQLYSKYSISLQGILLRIVTYINKSEHCDELYRRLQEELIDMHDKCSSGFAYRLINTLSGYCEHNVRISWADQVAGNLSGRLNSRIRELEDIDYQTNILAEMTLNQDNSVSDRSNFMKFFRESLPYIREELFDIFKDDMTDTDFDLYLRRAIIQYEGHQW